jgi:hypothetical protein
MDLKFCAELIVVGRVVTMNHADDPTFRLPKHSVKLPPWGATLRTYRAEGKRFGVWLASCAVVLADRARRPGGLNDEAKKEISDALLTK